MGFGADFGARGAEALLTRDQLLDRMVQCVTVQHSKQLLDRTFLWSELAV